MTFFLHEVTQYMSSETVFGLQRGNAGSNPEEAEKAGIVHDEDAKHVQELEIGKK